MKCDFCQEREAAVYLSETVNDETRELHLCQQCAQEKGIESQEPFGLGGLLAGLADFNLRSEEEPKKSPSCPRCKLSYDDFRKSGRLGCGSCYEAFHKYLAPLLKRIHGSTHHIGRTPAEAAASERPKAAAEDQARLKDLLAKAVAAENFEEAARLRDRLRALEAKQRKSKGAAG